MQSIAQISNAMNEVAVPTPVSAPSEVQAQSEQVSEPTLTNSRKRSWVWEHFNEYDDKTVIKVKGKPDTIVINKRAKCKYCPKGRLIGDYAVDSVKNGTQGMLRHINKGCKFYPGNRVVDKN